jgi:hypothetical protein
VILDCVEEIRKLFNAFDDPEIRSTFILCVLSQIREERVPKEKELELMRRIHDDY